MVHTHFCDEQVKIHTEWVVTGNWGFNPAIKGKVNAVTMLQSLHLCFFKNIPNEEAGECDLNKETMK